MRTQSVFRVLAVFFAVLVVGLIAIVVDVTPSHADTGAPPPSAAAEPGLAAPPAIAPPAPLPQAGAEAGLATGACPELSSAPNASIPAEDESISGQARRAMAEGNLLFAMLLVLVGGLLTALSPCVYPLIPITLSILGARQASSHFKGFLLSATYVGGMVILYSALGVGFAAAGFLAGSALQSPLVTVGVALFCILMSASMFGAFELALPASLQTRLSQAGGTGYRGAFIMGLVAGIIAAPCTGPVLSFVLTMIARDGDIAKGALLMVAYALGMGLPFLVLGTFSQAIARMPKSGRWMEVVKSVFGLLMLGAGLYYLRIGFPALGEVFDPLGRNAWLAPLLVVVGVAAGALHLSFKFSTPTEKARKGVGVSIATAGLVSFLAWANSGPAAVEPSAGSAPAIAWTVVGNAPNAVATFDDALALAKKSCKPVMIDFFAEWCVACKELDHQTYPDHAVRQEALRFTAVKVDATNESDALNELQKRFSVVGLPTVVFVDGRGNVLRDPSVTGFVDAPTYAALMKRVR